MAKSWEKPKIIAIVRGTPEEAVLEVCKGGQIISNGAARTFTTCRLSVVIGLCADCTTLSAS